MTVLSGAGSSQRIDPIACGPLTSRPYRF
jgi:hypothetical protein